MLKSPVGLEAIAEVFNRWAGLARLKQLPIADLFGAAAQLQAVGAKRLVADLYKLWIAYNPENPALYAVYFNYGVALTDLRDHAAAINAFRQGIRLKPDFHPPYINLGRALEDSGQGGRGGRAVDGALLKRLAAITGESVVHKITALQQIRARAGEA